MTDMASCYYTSLCPLNKDFQIIVEQWPAYITALNRGEQDTEAVQ